jgi:hypothetical protein
MNRREKRSAERNYTEVISVRLTQSEKRKFDSLIANLGTNKSELLRKKIKRLLYSITDN